MHVFLLLVRQNSTAPVGTWMWLWRLVMPLTIIAAVWLRGPLSVWLINVQGLSMFWSFLSQSRTIKHATKMTIIYHKFCLRFCTLKNPPSLRDQTLIWDRTGQLVPIGTAAQNFAPDFPAPFAPFFATFFGFGKCSETAQTPPPKGPGDETNARTQV